MATSEVLLPTPTAKVWNETLWAELPFRIFMSFYSEGCRRTHKHTRPPHKTFNTSPRVKITQRIYISRKHGSDGVSDLGNKRPGLKNRTHIRPFRLQSGVLHRIGSTECHITMNKCSHKTAHWWGLTEGKSAPLLQIYPSLLLYISMEILRMSVH